MVINIISLNVRGLNNKQKRAAIFSEYRSRCDILCLQETYSTEEVENIWRNEWGGEVYFDHGDSNSRGTGIFVNKSICKQCSNFQFSHQGRWSALQVMDGDKLLTICNVYAPNKDSPGFFEDMLNKLKEVYNSLVVVGDFKLCIGYKFRQEGI